MLSRHGFIYQVRINLTLSHLVSVVNMMEENTEVAEVSSDDEFSSVVIPYPLRLPRSTIVFVNKIERDKSFMQGEGINFVGTYCIFKCLLQLSKKTNLIFLVFVCKNLLHSIYFIKVLLILNVSLTHKLCRALFSTPKLQPRRLLTRPNL